MLSFLWKRFNLLLISYLLKGYKYETIDGVINVTKLTKAEIAKYAEEEEEDLPYNLSSFGMNNSLLFSFFSC